MKKSVKGKEKRQLERPGSTPPVWLLLVFSLPSKRASERVEVWRRLKRIGAIPLGPPGYLLPYAQRNEEQFAWLAATIRGYKGQASLMQVHAIDDLPSTELVKRFNEARARDYQEIIQQVAKLQRHKQKAANAPQVANLRRRLDEIASIDFFHSVFRDRAKDLLQRATELGSPARPLVRKSNFQNTTWVTRPRPGIDRVSSAWLIRKFIDPGAKFAFSPKPSKVRNAVSFDAFEGGFTHQGDCCTFETLCREFAINDPKVVTLAQIVHDADLRDDKYQRSEGEAIDAVLVGWAEQSIDDHELLRRGMELFEGLYRSL